MSRKFVFSLLFCIWLSFFSTPVLAQQSDTYPLYIVQSGDTLSLIAQKFGITLDELLAVNDISNSNILNVGMQLNIPGYPGVTGILEIRTVNLGDSFYSISDQYQITPEQLANLNRITSPSSFFAGSEFIVPVQDKQKKTPIQSHFPDMSLSEIALLSNSNAWSVSLTNNSQNQWNILPGDQFSLPEGASPQNLQSLANPITEISITPLPLVQGSTIVFHLKTSRPLSIVANLAGHQINFYPDGENNYYGLEGIHALDTPGLKDLEITASGQDNEKITIQQQILLSAGSFIHEAVNGVDSNTIDQNVIKQEDDILKVISTTSSTKLWNAPFKYPVDDPCMGSTFGNRRTYNNGTYNYYHTGVDFSVCKANNLNIYAVAPGVVVFTGLLPTKGNFTVIDHGWGVYSCYAHQSEFKVQVGDHVDAGQNIGTIGNTGRTLGPHLHWEVWVNHIPIDPLAWVKQSFPE